MVCFPVERTIETSIEFEEASCSQFCWKTLKIGIETGEFTRAGLC